MPASAAATRHISENDLEVYALDPLADATPIEEHLLVCEECRVRLVGWDEYVGAMREAKVVPNRVWCSGRPVPRSVLALAASCRAVLFYFVDELDH